MLKQIKLLNTLPPQTEQQIHRRVSKKRACLLFFSKAGPFFFLKSRTIEPSAAHSSDWKASRLLSLRQFLERNIFFSILDSVKIKISQARFWCCLHKSYPPPPKKVLFEPKQHKMFYVCFFSGTASTDYVQFLQQTWESQKNKMEFWFDVWSTEPDICLASLTLSFSL